jgi:hypothetical protein
VFIQLPKVRFCAGEPPVRFTLSHSDGVFSTGNTGIVKKDNEFYFDPKTVGIQTLVYGLPDGRRSELVVEVVAMPSAKFSFTIQQNKHSVQFINESKDASRVIWNFGNDKTETIDLAAGVNGNVQHNYGRGNLGKTFTVKLTASNGNCTNTASLDVVLSNPDAPTIEAKPLYCFNNEIKEKLSAEPPLPTGVFKSTSSLLDISQNGSFIPNVPGLHEVTYKAPGMDAASANIFILPGTVNVENAFNQKRLERCVFEVVLPDPIDHLEYQFIVKEKTVEMDKMAPEKNKPGFSRYHLFFNGSEKNAVLDLRFMFNDKTICDKISQPFEIKPENPNTPRTPRRPKP